jgi:predicted nucleic acid-binding protein
MTTYVDTSALLAAYVPEAFSAPARDTLAGIPQVPFNELHQLEVTNALALLLGRRQITAGEHRSVHALVQGDLANRRLLPVALDWGPVFDAARKFSQAHTRRLLTRSLDLLHVAAAHATACRIFVSADDRQLAGARATGLAVVDIKRSTRKRRS